MTAYAPYPAYRPSGVDWLGEIPAHWELRRLKFLASINPSKSEVSHLAGDIEVSFLPMERVGNGDLNLELKRPLKEVKQGFTYFRDGDVIVAKITPSFENGKGVLAWGLENGIGFGTTELHVIRASTVLDRRYVYYLTLTHQFRGMGETQMFGTAGQKRVPDSFINNFPTPSPSLAEQRAIAAFLDRETVWIDTLIAKKRELIDLLNRQRTAIISHAVTKGLNPTAPLKPSGVEWLGGVPAHWEVRRLKFLASVNPSKAEVSHLADDLNVSFLPMERVGNGTLNLELKRPLKEVRQGFTYFRDGDVIVAKITPSFENGKGVLAWGLENGIGFGTTELHVIRASNIFDHRYVYYLTLTYQFRGMGETQMFGTAGQKRIPDSFINDFPTPLPPLAEQHAIVDFLDHEISRIDKLIAKIETSIALLQKQRTALISATVTGKIDVRSQEPV